MFGIDQIKEAISKIFDLTATYQKYEAALSVSLGSQKKATEALGMLQNYADKSNFEFLRIGGYGTQGTQSQQANL